MPGVYSALSAAAVALVVVTAPGEALANPNDISIRGLGRPTSGAADDPAVLRFRNLANELAVAIAPRPLAPAETLGMNGFEFSLATIHTPISADEPYWQGQPGNPIFEGVTTGRDVPTAFWSPTAHIRKGLPLSTEVGIQGSYLAYSRMFALGADFKIALHESFFRWFPALSARAAFGRLFGASDLDITTGEVDGIMSIPIGIGGMMQITPFAGGGMLFVHVNSQIIDETPYLVTDKVYDQKAGWTGSLYNFPTIAWDENYHPRVFLGARFIYAFVELVYEFDIVLLGPNNVQSHAVKIGLDV